MTKVERSFYEAFVSPAFDAGIDKKMTFSEKASQFCKNLVKKLDAVWHRVVHGVKNGEWIDNKYVVRRLNKEVQAVAEDCAKLNRDGSISSNDLQGRLANIEQIFNLLVRNGEASPELDGMHHKAGQLQVNLDEFRKGQLTHFQTLARKELFDVLQTVLPNIKLEELKFKKEEGSRLTFECRGKDLYVHTNQNGKAFSVSLNEIGVHPPGGAPVVDEDIPYEDAFNTNIVGATRVSKEEFERLEKSNALIEVAAVKVYPDTPMVDCLVRYRGDGISRATCRIYYTEGSRILLYSDGTQGLLNKGQPANQTTPTSELVRIDVDSYDVKNAILAIAKKQIRRSEPLE